MRLGRQRVHVQDLLFSWFLHSQAVGGAGADVANGDDEVCVILDSSKF
jgi:hypothetical protein